ncbi:MAG: hypothetical protein Kow0081_4450 [Candidatus Dojkabacteria bacterium]
MNLDKLAIEIFKKYPGGQGITSSDLPDRISFPKNITKRIKSIERYTNKNTKDQGAAGWEYAFSVLLVQDELYISSVQSGNYENVKVSHSYKVRPEIDQKRNKLQLIIRFDNLTIKSKYYELQEFTPPIIHGLIATFHTHPKYFYNRHTFQYTFFSPQDIFALVYGRTPVLGLIAGGDIWLAVKTVNAKQIPGELLLEASKIELQAGMDAVKNFVKQQMRNFGICFYYGKVGGTFTKINAQ